MWLYIYYPHLFLQFWHSDLYNQQPLVLLENKNQCVLDANSLATNMGIHNGMNVATASALAPGCHFIPFNRLSLSRGLENLRF